MHMRRVSLIAPVIIALLALTPSAAGARSLSYGATGTDVTALQQALIDRGYLAPASAVGRFGPATLAAVRQFQCAEGIVCAGAAYGLAGPRTQGALGLSASGAPPPFEISGWIPYWRAATGTADVLPRLSSFSAVMPFGYIVQNDGTLHDAFGLDAPMSTTSATLIAAAKAKGVKVVPTVMWGNGAAAHAVLANQASRVALEDRVAALVTANGFDGVNIDFEGKHAETKDYFSTFLRGLDERLGGKLLYCAIEARTPVADRYGDAIPPPDATEYANDFAAINKHCDRVELMTYDQQTVDARLTKSQTAAGGPYVPIADPAWVAKVVNLAAKDIPKKKLVIGIATYGYEWKVTPIQSGFRYDMQWAFNPRYATALAGAIGALPARTRSGELSFIYNPSAVPEAVKEAASAGSVSSSSGTGAAAAAAVLPTLPSADGTYHIVWWSDAQAVAEKIALAKKLGVAGVALFKLDGGGDPGIWSQVALAAR